MITFLEKEQFSALAPEIFAILDGNMRRILPERLPYEEEYRLWYEAVSEGLRRPPRQMILAQDPEGKILGFVQYYANDRVLMLEEVQILPEYHRKASFLPRLWKFLLQALPVSPAYVEAFVHPQNTYSISLLTKLGMECIDHREYDHYRGDFSPSIRRK